MKDGARGFAMYSSALVLMNFESLAITVAHLKYIVREYPCSMFTATNSTTFFKMGNDHESPFRGFCEILNI